MNFSNPPLALDKHKLVAIILLFFSLVFKLIHRFLVGKRSLNLRHNCVFYWEMFLFVSLP